MTPSTMDSPTTTVRAKTSLTTKSTGPPIDHHEKPSGATFSIFSLPRLIWGFTGNDFFTFAVPNSLFGILGALAASYLAEGLAPSWLEIAKRVPLIIGFNWYTLLVCDLANQRSPEAVKEDLINKPWRPIPSNQISQDQTRIFLLSLVPITLAMDSLLGVFTEGTLIHILVWTYNDLGGGDELIRDLLLAMVYGFYNTGSLRIALGNHATIGLNGYVWVFMISGVILTTMQVQDLKDQAGDRARGRKTLPLILGEPTSRSMIAFFTLAWSVACAWFWDLGLLGYGITVPMGLTIAAHVLMRRTIEHDTKTWKMWCVWLVCLYCLPAVAAVFKV